MPDAYLTTYVGNPTLSLGNDNNIDLTTDINTVTVTTGDISGTVLGGEGIDNIMVNVGNIDEGTLSLGSNNDSIQLLKGYIQGNNIGTDSTINMGAGNDTLKARGISNRSIVDMGTGNDTVILTDTMGLGGGQPTLILGQGSDNVTINTLAQGTIYTGTSTANEDGAIDTVKIDSISGGNLYLGAGDTLNNVAGTGYTSMSSGLITYSDAADTLTLSSLTGGDVIMGNGNDTLTVNSNITNGNIDMGAGNDTFALNGNMSGNNQLVTGGAGSDTLLFAGTSPHTVSLNATRHIENFDLTNGHSGDVLTIDNRSASNILTIARNLDGNIIKVNGDVGDTVQFDNGLIPQFRSVSSDLAGYHEYTYTNSGTTYLLYIDTDMTII